MCTGTGDGNVMEGMCSSLFWLKEVVSSVCGLVVVWVLCVAAGKDTHSVWFTGHRIMGRSSPSVIFGNSSPLARITDIDVIL